jgi:phosphoribosylcarboxyaminoimidazole (NCAIR) mutase
MFTVILYCGSEAAAISMVVAAETNTPVMGDGK